MHKTLRLFGLCAITAIVAGCRQEGIRVYEVPRQGAASAPRTQVPEGWTEAPLGEMRVGSFAVSGNNGAKADVSIVALPNMGGRDLESVNRWRSAVGQKPLTEADLATNAQPVTIGGLQGRLYETAGASAENDEPTRIMGAVVTREEVGWYIKMTGDDKLVTSQKSNFLAFLKGYDFAPRHQHTEGDGHNHGAEMPSAAGGATDPHAGLNVATAPPPPESGAPMQSYPAPANWQQQTPGNMQQAKFSIQGGKATVTIAEAGGGMGMNVNRWRGQIGLPAVGEAEAEKAVSALDVNGVQAKLVDLSGTSQSMVVVVVPKADASVFFKLMGDPAVVAAEKSAFIEFAKKVK